MYRIFFKILRVSNVYISNHLYRICYLFQATKLTFLEYFQSRTYKYCKTSVSYLPSLVCFLTWNCLTLSAPSKPMYGTYRSVFFQFRIGPFRHISIRFIQYHYLCTYVLGIFRHILKFDSYGMYLRMYKKISFGVFTNIIFCATSLIVILSRSRI